MVYRQRCAAFANAVKGARGAVGAVVEEYEMPRATDPAGAAAWLAERLCAERQRPTAVFVPVDRVTVHVHRELERRGIAVGTEVELLSCDNEAELLSLVRPRPVSVDLNREEIARLAVERLLWRMRHGTWSPQVVMSVTPTLVGASLTNGHDGKVSARQSKERTAPAVDGGLAAGVHQHGPSEEQVGLPPA